MKLLFRHLGIYLLLKNYRLTSFVRAFRLRKHLFFNGINVILTYKCNLVCPYCYEKGIKYGYNDMRVDDFKKIVSWLIKNKKNKIILLGGEPTQHDDFKAILKICENHDLFTVLLTNLIFDKSILESMINYKGAYFGCQVHINNPDTYKDNKYDLVCNNLIMLKKNKKYTVLRYNICGDNDDFADVIKLAKEIDNPIRFSLVNNPLACESGIKKGQGSIKNVYLKDKLIKFLEACNKERVSAFFARPVPKCLFTPSEIKKYQRNAIKFKCYIGRNGDYTARLNINPDLSVMGCYGVPIIGPKLTSFDNHSDLSDYYKGHFIRLRAIPSMQECLRCQDYLDDICQGGCLSEKEDWDLQHFEKSL